jgi:hypothetical protein
MNIRLNAEVHCPDGAGGHTTAVIVDPLAQQLTHIVVESHETTHLVPFAAIAHSGDTGVQLHWTQSQLAQAAPFEEVVYVGDEGSGVVAPPSAVVPYTLDPEYALEAVELSYLRVEQVPEGHVAIHRNAAAEATDGRAGEIDAFAVDQATGQITHVMLHHGHLWAKRHVAVPVSAVDHVLADTVVLNVDKAAADQLSDVSPVE